ncbi:MAG: hypothetical protein CVV33_02195 [Methanomicrobiales archaeon HGW-Methanomicrobiales-4]|nr:MAG: hypothetical protein CVV33_02195 [Methanomicrobiales archaeon HGW-Methanomicrobiales-4]
MNVLISKAYVMDEPGMKQQVSQTMSKPRRIDPAIINWIKVTLYMINRLLIVTLLKNRCQLTSQIFLPVLYHYSSIYSDTDGPGEQCQNSKNNDLNEPEDSGLLH